MFDGGIAAAAIAAFGAAKKKPSPTATTGIVPASGLGSGLVPSPAPGRSAAIVATAGRMLQEMLNAWIDEVYAAARRGSKSIAFHPRVEIRMDEEFDMRHHQQKLLVRMDVRLVLTDGGMITPKDANQFELVHLREPDDPIPFDHIEHQMKKALVEAMPRFREAFNMHEKAGKVKIKVDSLYGYAPPSPSLMPPSMLTSKAEYEKLVLEMAEMKKKMALEQWANDMRRKEAVERAAAAINAPANLAWDPAKEGKS